MSENLPAVVDELQPGQRPQQAEDPRAISVVEAGEGSDQRAIEVAPETDPKVIEAAGENDEEPTHLTSIDHDDQNDSGQWDAAKAETMAAVLTDTHKGELKDEQTGEVLSETTPDAYRAGNGEASQFDRDIKERDATKQWVNSEKAKDVYTEEERAGLAQSERLLEINKDEPNETREYYERGVVEARAALDKAIAEQREKGEDLTQRSKEKVDRDVDAVLSPYEKLYDLNPAVFAEMPTAEFMGVVREIREVDNEIDRRDNQLKKTAAWERKFKALEEEESELPHTDYLKEDVEDILYTLHTNRKDFKAALDALTEIGKDRYRVSPAQRNERYLHFVQDLAAKISAKTEDGALLQRRQAILDRYQPTTQAA